AHRHCSRKGLAGGCQRRRGWRGRRAGTRTTTRAGCAQEQRQADAETFHGNLSERFEAERARRRASLKAATRSGKFFVRLSGSSVSEPAAAEHARIAETFHGLRVPACSAAD